MSVPIWRKTLKAAVRQATDRVAAGEQDRAAIVNGIERDVRCGYPVGLSYPPDWGERTISLRSTDTTVLEPGMTFHFMPGIWMDDWGLEITETILITDDGAAERLCDVPRELMIVT